MVFISQNLRVLSFIAPLLHTSRATSTPRIVLRYEKNVVNRAMHGDILIELQDYIMQTEELADVWNIYLMDINQLYYLYLSHDDAQGAMAQMLDCSNINLHTFIAFDTSLHGVRNFVTRCFELLGIKYMPLRTNISDVFEQINGRHKAIPIEICVPCSLCCYARLSELSSYNFGLTPETVTFLREYLHHDANSPPWLNVAMYRADPNARQPTIDFNGIVVHANEMLDSEQNTADLVAYSSGITMVPTAMNPHKARFLVVEMPELLEAGYFIAYPRVVDNTQKIDMILRKVRQNAEPLTLPFPMAKLIATDTLCIPCCVQSIDIIGPS